MTDSKGEMEWYPGLRPENTLPPDQIKLLARLQKGQVIDGISASATKLICSLYATALSATGIADQFHDRASRNGSELVTAHQRIEQLEAGAVEFGIRHKTVMEQVVKQAVDVRQTLNFQDRQRRETELCVARWQRELDVMRKEIEALTKHKEIFSNVVKQMKEMLICPICCEPALLPKVVGTCGHIACENCLRAQDDFAFTTLTQAASAGGASARQHLLARRCPLCRVEIIGNSFPVLPLKGIAALLVENELIEVSEQTVNKSLVEKKLAYQKETAESKHMTALQMGCWAQSQLAQHSVGGVIQRVSRQQWLDGVYILFEAAVSRVFFETFATTLHGKAGGVNVLVNASQRMLAVQIVNRKPVASVETASVETAPVETAPVEPSGSGGKQHLLIKVSTDGRFVVTKTPAASAALPTGTPVVAGSGSGDVAALASQTR
jgi:hypothetical protein